MVEDLPCECVLIFLGTVAGWDQNLGVFPNLGAGWRKINVIRQTSDQAGNNNHHVAAFGLPDERDDVVGFRTFNGQWQGFAFVEKIRLLSTQAQSSPNQEQLDSTVFWSFE